MGPRVKTLVMVVGRLGLLVLSGCARCGAGPVAPVDPNATCASFCAHARMLGCPGAAPTPGGMSCEDRCAIVQKGVAPWNLGCRTAAPICDAIDACEKGP